MKAFQLLAVGAVTFSVSFVAAGMPAPSPALVHETISSSDNDRTPASCLIGTEKCTAKNGPPKICPLDPKSGDSCATDGFKIIDADSR